MKTREGIGGRIFSTFLLLAALWLAGCKTAGAGGWNSSSANLHDPKPHILFRVVCIDDFQGQSRPTCDIDVNLWRLGDPNGKIAALPKKFSPSQSRLSKSAAGLGWKDIVVDPGTYCMQILPAGSGSVVFDETNRPVYFLKVSASQSVTYAGTIVFNRHFEKRKHKGFPDSFKGTEFSVKDLWNETEAAKQLAGNELAGLGGVAPCILRPYDTPSLISQSGLAQVRAGAIAMPAVSGNQSYLESVGASPFMAPGEVVLAVAGYSGDAGIYVVGAGLALMVVGAPIAFTTEAIKTHAHHKKWAPYQAALQNELAFFHLDERLRERLASRLGADADSSAPALWLQIQPYRVVLRGDEHQKYALEIAVRVQLFDSSEGTPIWEHSYVNAATASRMNFELCETFVESSTPSHRLEDFGGDSGAELMRSQLQAAVEDLTRAISLQMNGAGQLSSPLAIRFAGDE